MKGLVQNGGRWIALGAGFGFLGVALGAFGAHWLKARLSPEDLAIFEVGVRYQMYHALALLLIGGVRGSVAPGLARCSGAMFTVGIVVFSGSLYGLVLAQARWLGVITPMGGIAFLAGWLLLLVSATRPRPAFERST